MIKSRSRFRSFRFAFVTFENESDAAEGLKAHTTIGGEKVNVSFAFASSGKKEEKKGTENNNNKTQENQSNKKTEAKKEKQQQKPKKEKVVEEKQLSTNVIYVGQLPENVAEDEVKKLFPKSSKIELIPAKANNKGVRPGFAFVSFADDASAAAAVKAGPTLTLKGSQLKVAYQTKRATTGKSD